MKELILPKINATSKYVDIYNYLISTGHPFEEVAKMMTSDVFNYIVKISDYNIYDPVTYGFTLEKALQFFLGQSQLPIIDNAALKSIETQYMRPKKMQEIDYFKSEEVSAFKNWAYQQIKNSRDTQQTTDYDDEYINQMSDEDFEESSNQARYGRNLSTNPLTKNDYLKLYRLLEYVEYRNTVLKSLPNKEESIEILTNLINKIIPATLEMQITGSMFGINQGIATNAYDKYSKITRIENFFTNKLKYPFNLMEFINNEEYRLKSINDYDKVKIYTNPLQAITTIPHYNEMFKIHYVDSKIINWLSAKNRIESVFARKIFPDGNNKLNRFEYRELQSYVNDLLIYKWLKTQNLQFTVPIGQTYFKNGTSYTETNSTPGFTISLNTPEGIASFKKLMDESIIPNLRQDPRFKDNTFLQGLTRDIREYRFNVNRFWRMPINMMQVDNSVKNTTLYESLLSGFMQLNGKQYDGHNIVDLFYLYNLITHKDGFGQSSMTRLFEEFVADNDSNLLVNQYYKYLGETDRNQNLQIEYSLDDLKYRLSLVSPNPATKYDSVVYPNGTVIIDQQGKAKSIDATKIDSNFTLNLPNMIGNVVSVVLELKEVRSKDSRFYKNPLSVRQLIYDIGNSFLSKYNGGLQIVEDSDLLNEDAATRNAKAYIKDGVVYVNVDKADLTSPLHELTHVVMAGLKFENPDIYYHLVSLVDSHPLYKKLSESPEYANKRGSDLKEEVFATIMTEYFQNKLREWNANSQIEGSIDAIKQALNNIFQIKSEDLDLQSLMNTDLETVLYNFGSLLTSSNFDSFTDVSNVVLNQRIATIKDQLLSDDTITQECYE